MLHSYLLNGEETENLVIVETDFIKNCSVEVKTIIAFYSKNINNYLDTDNSVIFGNILGNYDSLDEAQNALLQNKEKYFQKIKSHDYFLRYLKIEIKGNTVFVTIPGEVFSDEEIDEYIIHENRYIAHGIQ